MDHNNTGVESVFLKVLIAIAVSTISLRREESLEDWEFRLLVGVRLRPRPAEIGPILEAAVN